MSANPFSGKMDTDSYLRMGQALRENGFTLDETHRIAEIIHAEFFKQDKYKTFESFKDAYYKRHVTKRA